MSLKCVRSWSGVSVREMSARAWKIRREEMVPAGVNPLTRSRSVRTTFLTAVLALLTIGCGIDSDPAAPEDLGLTPPEPAVLPSEPEFATAATNVWTTKAPMRAARSVLVAGVVNGVLYAVGGSTEAGGAVATVEA